MKIGIIGMGMVGEAVAFGLRRIGHEVVGYDPNPDKGCDSFAPLLDTKLVFICVPTPVDQDFRCDTSLVHGVIATLSSRGYRGLAIIKSTVPPGTTDRLMAEFTNLQIAFCPEFLRERARFYDFYENMEVCIVGAHSSADYDLVVDAHGSIPKHIVRMMPAEAELAKYFVNCFNAYRINFANAFFDVCGQLGCDYKKIKDAVAYRADTKSAYLDSNEGFRAFGGACLPKDTQAFATFVHELGLYTPLFAHIVVENKRVERNILMLRDAYVVQEKK